jgi:hypothetical protein
MAEGPIPTSPGLHNHISRVPQGYQSRGNVDKVFGVDAPVICGCPIECGSGARETEWQLAQHVLRVLKESGADAARALFYQLRDAAGINKRKLDAELVDCGFMAKETAEAGKRLADFQPGGISD